MSDVYAFHASENPLTIGDKVRVLRSATHSEYGWKATWNLDMNFYIGKVSEVVATEPSDGRGVKLRSLLRTDSFDFYFPHFVLEKVDPSTKLDMEPHPYWGGDEYQLAPGTKVRITRAASNFENGWKNGWNRERMSRYINVKGHVTEDHGIRGVNIDTAGPYFYPHFVLEVLEDE